MQGFYTHEEEKGVLLLSQMGVDPKEWLIEEGSVISVFRFYSTAISAGNSMEYM